MTIIEMLIAASITLMLLVMIGQMLGPAMRYTSEGSIRVELQQSASLAINQMVADMQRTNNLGVSLAPPATAADPMVMSVDRMYDTDPNGFPIYENTVQVYYSTPSNGTLQKKTYPPAPPTLPLVFNPGAPISISAADLNNIVGQTNATERMLAHYVTSFLVQASGGVLRISLTLQQSVPNTQRQVDVQFTRDVYLRNCSS